MALHVRIRNGMSEAREDDVMGFPNDILQAAGVVNLSGGDLLVEAQASPNMTIKVAPGTAYVLNAGWSANIDDETRFWQVVNHDSTNLNIGSNSSGSTRIDIICVKIDTVQIPDGEASNVASLLVIAGTPGAGVPATPSNHLKLAEITVTNGAASIVTGNITDSRVQITLKSAIGGGGGGGGSANFWNDVPGTPVRVSDTQFTITDTANANLYDQIFKKGVLLKWLESSTFQTAQVISSSYSANTVTINIVGDSLTAGFTAMKYCINMVQKETFIIPGILPSSSATDIARTFYVPEDIYLISADLRLKTAGAGAGSTVVDINDDGTTKFTTKPTITTTGTNDLNNVADNPSTLVAKDSAITIDVDSITATAPAEAYIDIFFYPVSWRYRT